MIRGHARGGRTASRPAPKRPCKKRAAPGRKRATAAAVAPRSLDRRREAVCKCVPQSAKPPLNAIRGYNTSLAGHLSGHGPVGRTCAKARGAPALLSRSPQVMRVRTATCNYPKPPRRRLCKRHVAPASTESCIRVLRHTFMAKGQVQSHLFCGLQLDIVRPLKQLCASLCACTEHFMHDPHLMASPSNGDRITRNQTSKRA